MPKTKKMDARGRTADMAGSAIALSRHATKHAEKGNAASAKVYGKMAKLAGKNARSRAKAARDRGK